MQRATAIADASCHPASPLLPCLPLSPIDSKDLPHHAPHLRPSCRQPAYPDAGTTFTEIAGRLGGHLRRIPDGETGERARWIFWQRARVTDHPAMEVAADEDKAQIHQWDGKLIREWELFRFRAGIDPATVAFDPGYAPDAIASYARFLEMRSAGTIPAGVRFQVCLPTPMAIGYWFVAPASPARFLRRLRARLQGRSCENLRRHPP